MYGTGRSFPRGGQVFANSPVKRSYPWLDVILLPMLPHNGARVWGFVKGFAEDESGQGLLEYALIISLIALGVIGLMTQLGNKTSETFSTATFNLP